MKKLSLFFLVSLVGHGAFGQQYKTAVGIKGDWSTLNVDMAEFSVKHFWYIQIFQLYNGSRLAFLVKLMPLMEIIHKRS